jgi:tRNA acetyltransferase TAN1
MASPAKRPRSEGRPKTFFSKQAKKSQQNRLEVGDKGFVITCNFKERDCIRECYGLLNEYHTKSLQQSDEAVKKTPDEDDEDDITSQLQDQIEKTKDEVKDRAQKFQSIETGVQNCLFIKTTVDDPLELGTRIIRDLAESKKKRTKVTLRMLPIETVCKAKIEDIKNAAGLLFDKHFLKVPSTFGINFNRRFNAEIQRDEVIKELADLVAMKNPLNKVNLKDPQQSVIVEIIKGNCLLSVVPDYIKLKKYNINELWDRKDKEVVSEAVEGEEAEVKSEEQ